MFSKAHRAGRNRRISADVRQAHAQKARIHSKKLDILKIHEGFCFFRKLVKMWKFTNLARFFRQFSWDRQDRQKSDSLRNDTEIPPITGPQCYIDRQL